MRMLIHVLVCSLCVQAARADDWFWIDAKINGKRARLVLDTGCEPNFVLFRHAAERLHLNFQAGERGKADQMPYWLTDECTIKLPWCFWGLARAKGQLTVVEIPEFMRESIARLEKLAAEPESMPADRAALVNYYNVLPFYYGIAPQDEVARMRRSIELSEQLVKEFPDEPSYKRGLARSYGILGRCLVPAHLEEADDSPDMVRNEGFEPVRSHPIRRKACAWKSSIGRPFGSRSRPELHAPGRRGRGALCSSRAHQRE